MRPFFILPLLIAMSSLSFADEASDAIQEAKEALKSAAFDKAIKAATIAIDKDDKNAVAYFIRGEAESMQRKTKEAFADFDQALKLDPKYAIAYDRRGSEAFKLGKIKESIADFDTFIKMQPKAEESHWKRGISCYYAARFADGAKQFKFGEKVYGNDVENAFWHYLCNARDVGVEKARKEMLKIGNDTRVPFMKIYDLILGKAKPEEILTAAEKAPLDKDDKIEALFYAHLYVALNYEAEGDKKKALETMEIAVNKYKISHYMWDVANTHLILSAAKK